MKYPLGSAPRGTKCQWHPYWKLWLAGSEMPPSPLHDIDARIPDPSLHPRTQFGMLMCFLASSLPGKVLFGDQLSSLHSDLFFFSLQLGLLGVGTWRWFGQLWSSWVEGGGDEDKERENQRERRRRKKEGRRKKHCQSRTSTNS